MLAAVSVAAVSSSCSQPAPVAPENVLTEIPYPDLSGADDTVRQQVQEKREEIEALAAADEPSKLSQAYGELGLTYLTYSFVDAAEVSFANARLLQQDNPRWPYLLGYLFQIQGRLEPAADVLENALKLQPNDLPALVRLGRVRLDLGANDQALTLFHKAFDLDPKSAAVLDGLGKVAAAQEDAQQAVEYFEQALELQPTASSIHHALGLAYRKLGDLEKATFHLSRGGEAPVQFADPYLKTVAELGRTADIYLVRGAQAFSEARYSQARGYYAKALELDPTSFDARKALGFCLEKLGDLEGAVEQLQEGLKAGTSGDAARDILERAELLRILGGLRVLQGRELDAIESFEESLALDPDRLDTRIKLANALARQGRLEDAVGHFDQILEQQPETASVLIQRATAYINLGRPQQAIADYENAVAVAPEDPEPRLRYAEALEHLGRSDEASQQRTAAATQAAADPQQQARMLADIASKKLSRGEIDAALKDYQEVVRLDPSNNDARYELATILGHFNRFEEALSQFTQVVDAAPHHGPARRGEVTALLLQSRYDDARARLQEGLEVMPRNRALAHGLARLLATAPLASVRDGELALQIATRVHQETRRADSAETLAMAFAEAGRFGEAIELQQQLLAAAEKNSAGGQSVERWQAELQSYKQSQPWTLKVPEEIITVMIDPPANRVPSPN